MAGPFSLLTGLGMLFAGLAINPSPKTKSASNNTQTTYKSIEDVEKKLKVDSHAYREEAIKKLEQIERMNTFCKRMNDRFLKEAVIIDVVREWANCRIKEGVKNDPYPLGLNKNSFFEIYNIENAEMYARFRIAGFAQSEVPGPYRYFEKYFSEEWFVKDNETFNEAIERMSFEVGIEVLYMGIITERYTGDASKVPGYIDIITKWVDKEFNNLDGFGCH